MVMRASPTIEDNQRLRKETEEENKFYLGAYFNRITEKNTKI